MDKSTIIQFVIGLCLIVAFVTRICFFQSFDSYMKDYKKSPENYAGNVADAVKFVRFAITGRTNTPELYTIMKTISKPICINRLQQFINNNF